MTRTLTESKKELNMDKKKCSFTSLIKTVAMLRSDQGCPWDRKQTLESLQKYIREETDELLEAMQNSDYSHICEESGDILFLIVLLAEINRGNGRFAIEDVINGIVEKMIRRHPHVFAGKETGSEKELKEQWQKIKQEESEKKTN